MSGDDWLASVMLKVCGLDREADGEKIADYAWSMVPEHDEFAWRLFVDLKGWKLDEEVGAIVGNEDNMTTRARVALSIIAERVIRQVLQLRGPKEN